MTRYKEGAYRTAIRTCVAALVYSVLMLISGSQAAGQQKPTLVSINSTGTGTGDHLSGDLGRYRASADGRYVVFYSEASDLVPLDASTNGDIFVRDTVNNTTSLVSVNAAGTAAGNGISGFGLISADGRYVAFTSHANNLVANDTNTSPDVFLRDLQAGTTRLISINSAGTGSGTLGGSDLIDMSPDGRFITFSSHARDLTAHPDGNGLGTDIYVRDTVDNTTALVSVNSAGTASGNGASFGGSVSSDGRYVVFASQSSDLVANDSGTQDVFLRDLQAGTTTRLSTNADGTAGGNHESAGAVMDPGGRIVAFATRATDLSTLPDSNDLSDIFVYDVQTGTRRLVTVNVAGTAAGNGLDPFGGFFDHGAQFTVSDDARFIAFMSQSGDLVSNDTNGNSDDVFLYEVATSANSLVSANLLGTSGNIGGSFKPSISADGRFVAFESLANDLVDVADATNGFTTDVFVRDIAARKTHLASINHSGTRTGNGFSFQPFMSAGGTRLVFFSRASDLVTNDLNGFVEDVFAFDVPPAPQFRLDATNLVVSEGAGSVRITITRDGDASGSASVHYATTDGTAVDKKDYIAAIGRLRFAPGEISKSLDLVISDDRFDDDGESFQMILSDPVRATLGPQSIATVSITDNDAVSGVSPVKDATIDVEFFVRQHYADFLNRVPDQAGLDFWAGQMTGCGAADSLVCRINVSAAFFLSIEYQESGYLVHRAYKAAYGNLPGKPVPLTLREYLAGSRRVGDGVQVGLGNWQQQLEANKGTFFDEFTADSRFTSLYAGHTFRQYVDALNANTGGALSTAERNALVADLDRARKTRAQVLRAVAEDPDFAQGPERNRAFVLAQYFGYLRRNPDDVGFGGQPDPNFGGYLFWLGKLNQFNGNFIEAEMVRAFIQSIEYSERFGE